jgi:hypothetical protein
MLVAHQRVAGAKEEYRRKQVPLDLEKGVRTVVDVAHDRVAGADQGDDQDEPDDALADRSVSLSIRLESLSKPFTGYPSINN